MRPIDADKLKATINAFYDNNFKGLVPNELIKYAQAVDNTVDNAPTVEIPNYGGQVVPDMLQGWKYEERPQGDLISREALKKAIIELNLDNTSHWSVIHKINNAPAVEVYTKDDMTKEYLKGYNDCKEMTERPQGEWIDVPCERDLLYNTGIKYTCSVCGEHNCYGHPPFCMYCGADMRETYEKTSKDDPAK